MGRCNGESPFHTYAIGDFPDGEGCRGAFSLALDHITLEALDPLFVPFHDLIVDSNIVASLKAREGAFGGQLLMYKCYSRIHNLKFKDGKGRAFHLSGKEFSREIGPSSHLDCFLSGQR
jgi:hypothetical protein